MWLRKRSNRTKRNLKEEVSFHFYVKAINSVKQQRNRRAGKKGEVWPMHELIYETMLALH